MMLLNAKSNRNTRSKQNNSQIKQENKGVSDCGKRIDVKHLIGSLRVFKEFFSNTDDYTAYKHTYLLIYQHICK